MQAATVHGSKIVKIESTDVPGTGRCDAANDNETVLRIETIFVDDMTIKDEPIEFTEEQPAGNPFVETRPATACRSQDGTFAEDSVDRIEMPCSVELAVGEYVNGDWSDCSGELGNAPGYLTSPGPQAVPESRTALGCPKYKYKRTSTRGSWTEEGLQLAVEMIRSGEGTLRQASQRYHIPKSTLARHVKTDIHKVAKKPLGRFANTFTEKEEEQLVRHVVRMQTHFFGISYTELRELAFQFAEARNLEHRFNKAKGMASKKWLYSFLERNRTISMTTRNTEATSFARSFCPKDSRVQDFFVRFSSIVARHNISSRRLYNIAENTRSLLPSANPAVNGEQVELYTIVCAMSPEGHYLPPAFVFPRKSRDEKLMAHAPQGSPGFFQEKGLINTEIFIQYLEYFCNLVQPSSESPVLVIIDGRAAHTKSYRVVEFAERNHLTMLSVPRCAMRHPQPLEALFERMGVFFEDIVSSWQRIHPGIAFAAYQIAGTIAEAFEKAATVKTARTGFQESGLWPYNPDIFTRD